MFSPKSYFEKIREARRIKAIEREAAIKVAVVKHGDAAIMVITRDSNVETKTLLFPITEVRSVGLSKSDRELMLVCGRHTEFLQFPTAKAASMAIKNIKDAIGTPQRVWPRRIAYIAVAFVCIKVFVAAGDPVSPISAAANMPMPPAASAPLAQEMFGNPSILFQGNQYKFEPKNIQQPQINIDPLNCDPQAKAK